MHDAIQVICTGWYVRHALEIDADVYDAFHALHGLKPCQDVPIMRGVPEIANQSRTPAEGYMVIALLYID